MKIKKRMMSLSGSIMFLSALMFMFSGCEIDKEINVHKEFTFFSVVAKSYIYKDEKYIYRKDFRAFDTGAGYYLDTHVGMTQVGYARNSVWMKLPVYVSNSDVEQNVIMFDEFFMNYMQYVKEKADIPNMFDCSINSMSLYMKLNTTIPIYTGPSFKIKNIVSDNGLDSLSFKGEAKEIDCGLTDYDYLRLDFSVYRGGIKNIYKRNNSKYNRKILRSHRRRVY